MTKLLEDAKINTDDFQNVVLDQTVSYAKYATAHFEAVKKANENADLLIR
jgi:hypothetical protein